MSEHFIKYSRRHSARKHSKALRDIYKIFTELITNSDESYNRLKKAGHESTHSKSIKIYIDRKTRIVKIVDCAEGMDLIDIDNNFEKYGAIKSGDKRGHRGRGLYGQGLTDVLFLNPASRSSLHSIKNGKLYTSEFYYKDDDQTYNSRILKDLELEKLRNKYDIPENGTVIQFKLPEKINLPQFQNLFSGLTSSYMLRFVNSNPDRQITLIETENNGKRIQKQIKYSFTEKVYPKNVSKVLPEKKLYFKYENFKPVEIEVVLYKTDFDLKQEIGNDATGLLVFDAHHDNSVYDLDFFGFENSPGANNVFGYIKLTNVREIIDQKLAETIPEEILTDTRDGFDKSHKFYKHFSNAIKDLLAPVFNELKESEKDESSESEETKKRHREVFDKLNKIYSELVGEKNGGTLEDVKSGVIRNLEFARDRIKVTVNKQYGLQLRINVNDFSDKAKIDISCSEPQILFSPETIAVKKSEANEHGIVSKHIKIKSGASDVVGTIIAVCEEAEARCVVSVVQGEIFYPKNGMEFNPDEFNAITNKKSRLHLFVDLEKIKAGESINLNSDNSSIVLLDKRVKVPSEKISGSKNVCIPVRFFGNQNNESGHIVARSGEYECGAKVNISDKNKLKPPGKDGGIFRGWKFGNMPEQTQMGRSQFGEDKGFIIINRKNPINKIYFGETPVRSDIDKSVIMQLYLAELILAEFLNLSVAEAYNKGNLGQKTDDPHTDISNHIVMKKLEIGPGIYETWVNKALHDDYKNIIRRDTDFSDANVLVSRVDMLSGRLREIVEMRFGLNENRKHTLDEIAIKFKLTRERIRQIINTALSKLYKEEEIAEVDLLQEESISEIGTEDTADKVDYIDRFEKSLNITADKIVEQTANFYAIKVSDMQKVSRKKEVVLPRQVAMYLIRARLKYSFPAIGDIFKRDHTTIIHAFNKIEDMCKTHDKVEKEVSLIQNNLANTNIDL